MPLPDALITSVGTRVFQRQVDGTWLEDQTWSAQLEEGWHLDAVREATYHAVAAVGRDGMHFRPPEEQNSHKVLAVTVHPPSVHWLLRCPYLLPVKACNAGLHACTAAPRGSQPWNARDMAHLLAWGCR